MAAIVVPGPRNRSMPSGIIIPELVYVDLDQAVVWLCTAFGFRERLRIRNHRCQLVFGAASEASIVAIQAERADWPPEDEQPSTNALMVVVSDVDAHYAHAQQYGARVIDAPADYPYGERQYSVLDLGGHRWTFTQSIDDVDPVSWGGLMG